MPTLKQDSSGPDVKDLQQKLKDLGFDPNGVDGNFGPGTRAAVVAFQQSKGLQADGIAGPATLAALQAATAGPPTSGGAVSGSTAGAAVAAATSPGVKPAAPAGQDSEPVNAPSSRTAR